ncbi:hypothetical protein [Burkholderia sp. JP2-270]|uniref:hypothetical protein n=1 Tax=Burkholderia sp. JP2-270 TaxID=2217913 RepID=UPI0013A6C5E1|nr:hypothetical protein [Burkholderia sp. JP2-270]
MSLHAHRTGCRRIDRCDAARSLLAADTSAIRRDPPIRSRFFLCFPPRTGDCMSD